MTNKIWVPMSAQMPAENELEIFIRKIGTNNKWLTPANEIWFDVSEDTLAQWEWRYPD